MQKRTWNKKYTKKKSSSQLIDEKIALLDREMRKTKLGESIANSTSGLYTVTGFDSGEPEIPAIPAVDPTYENVTGGLTNTDDFVWPEDQGDGSDPDTAPNIPSNLYATYNGEQVAALRQVDVDHGDGVVPLGLAFHGRAISSQVIGFITASGFNGVVQSGVFTTPGPYTDLQRAYLDAWNTRGRSGLFQYSTTKTVYFWGDIDCLFGSCYGGSAYYPSGTTNTSDPKAERVLYSYQLVIPTDASGNPLPNRFMTDPGSPEIPAVPAVPPRPIVLSRYGLGDPNYFVGFIKNIQDILGLGETAIKAISDYTSKLISPLADALGIAGTRLSTYATAAPPFLAHLAQQQGLVNYTENNPFKVWFPPQESANVANKLNNVLQTIPRERWENLSKDDLKTINAVMKPPGKAFTPYGYTFYGIGNPQAFSGRIKTDPNTGLSYVTGIQDTYVFSGDTDAPPPGAHELLNLAMTANNAQQRPDMQSSPYKYTPGVPGLDTQELKQKNTPIAVDLPPPQLTQSGFNSLPSNVKQQVMDTMKQNFLKQYDTSNYQGAELQYMRDRGKEAQKQAAQNTEFKNGYMIQKTVGPTGRVITSRTPLFKENKIQNGNILNESIDVENVKLKLREIDFLRNYKVSEKESKELENIIYKINLILDENPEHLEYLRKRYPKDDVRLAELNYKMDQMMTASKDYIDTHFPENQKLFKKVQQSIKRSIKLTDPKTYKNTVDTPSFKKLLSVDYVNKVDVPKKKPKLQNRNKKTAARFLKKPRIKSAMELIDEKIIQLEKDLKKTGIII